MRRLPTIDQSKPWWSARIRDGISYQDKQFYTASMASGGGYFMSPYVMIANVKLADELKINLLDEVESGEWTIDRMAQLFADFRSLYPNEDEMETEACMMAYAHAPVAFTAQSHYIAAGLPLSSINEEGKIMIDLDSEQSLGIMQKLRGVFADECRDLEWAKQRTSFREDRALLFGGNMAEVARVQSMSSEYVILPCPKASAEQAEYLTGVNLWDSAFWAYPETVGSDVDFVGYATEMLAYETYRHIKPVMYEALLGGRLVKDKRQVEILDEIYGGLYMDLNYVHDFTSTASMVASGILESEQNFKDLYGGIQKDIAATVELFGMVYAAY